MLDDMINWNPKQPELQCIWTHSPNIAPEPSLTAWASMLKAGSKSETWDKSFPPTHQAFSECTVFSLPRLEIEQQDRAL